MTSERDLLAEVDQLRDALAAERAAREDEAAGRSCMVCDRLTVERDGCQVQLAALRKAAWAVREVLRGTSLESGHEDASERLVAALTDAAPDAEAYEHRVRAAVLEKAAALVGSPMLGVGMQVGPHHAIEDWLLALAAAEIKRNG